MAVVRPPGQGGRRHDGEHARYRGPTNAQYPQSPSQKPGLGFPIARMVVLFCLATGAVLEAAVGKYQGKQTGENALYRRLWEEGLRAGDVSLGDRYYGSYFDIALLHRRGVDGVYRLHQLRVADFRRGRRLGKEDHVVTWSKPARPDWMERRPMTSSPRRWRCGWCGSTSTGAGSARGYWTW